MSNPSKIEVQITISEDCNLNCVYCYEHSKSSNTISYNTVEKILRHHLTDDTKTEIVFYLHGGEIGLHFDLVKYIYNLAKSINKGKRIKFAASTNGTLIHGEIKDWFRSHANDFSLGLSLDGTKYMHDVNRSNSYDKIDLDYFVRTWPNQSVKMTISPLTINQVAEGIIDILEKGFKISANLAYGCNWNHSVLKTNYATQLSKLANYLLEHPDIEPFRPLIKNFIFLGKLIYSNRCQIHKKWCGTGEFMVCYSPLGDKYPCQMFMPSSGASANSVPSEISTIDVDNFCATCSILSICPSCYGFNFLRTGRVIKSPDDICDYTKIETFVYSCMLSKMLESPELYIHTRKMSIIERALCIKAISYVQNKVHHEIESILY